LITGKAVSLFDNKFGTMTQSFGPEARGSACSSQLVISEDRVLYPYITRPEILVSMSQDAYEKYEPGLREGGTLIYDTDLVRLKPPRAKISIYGRERLAGLLRLVSGQFDKRQRLDLSLPKMG
jgi:2-oxoglutarate ferredoxin oxidoreductase subunit gamma